MYKALLLCVLLVKISVSLAQFDKPYQEHYKDGNRINIGFMELDRGKAYKWVENTVRVDFGDFKYNTNCICHGCDDFVLLDSTEYTKTYKFRFDKRQKNIVIESFTYDTLINTKTFKAYYPPSPAVYLDAYGIKNYSIGILVRDSLTFNLITFQEFPELTIKKLKFQYLKDNELHEVVVNSNSILTDEIRNDWSSEIEVFVTAYCYIDDNLIHTVHSSINFLKRL